MCPGQCCGHILSRFNKQIRMGLFSFTQEVAMDLGTANTIVVCNGKMVVDEPSMVALDRRTDKFYKHPLEQLIRQLQRKGYRFVPLTEALGYGQSQE